MGLLLSNQLPLFKSQILAVVNLKLWLLPMVRYERRHHLNLVIWICDSIRRLNAEDIVNKQLLCTPSGDVSAHGKYVSCFTKFLGRRIRNECRRKYNVACIGIEGENGNPTSLLPPSLTMRIKVNNSG